jgi:hypothetical protein
LRLTAIKNLKNQLLEVKLLSFPIGSKSTLMIHQSFSLIASIGSDMFVLCKHTAPHVVPMIRIKHRI